MYPTIDIFFILIGLISLLCLFQHKHWIFRVPGYLSIPFTLFAGLGVIIEFWLGPFRSPTSVFASIVLVSSFVYHLSRILPFTSLGKKEVQPSQGNAQNLDLILCNVYQKNRQFEKVIDLVLEHQPDLFFAFETNAEWGHALGTALIKDFPYHYGEYREDTYGMVVFSKIPIDKTQVKRIYNTTPSLKFTLKHTSMGDIRCYLMHPKPPSPTEATTSKPKDSELEAIANEIKEHHEDSLTLVAGDLNDVAWSRSTSKFLKKSGLFNPMKGRNLTITFPTYFRWFGFPLDQTFVSSHFKVEIIKKLNHIGSDHYPMYFSFTL